MNPLFHVAVIGLLLTPALAAAEGATKEPATTVPHRNAQTPKAKPAHARKPAAKPAPAHPTAPHGSATGAAPARAVPIVKPSPGTPSRRAAPHAPAVPPPVALAPPEPEIRPEPTKGSNSSLPLPRYAALRSADVNMRTGPGTRYPIEWVYQRRDLPVEVTREFDVWRLVQDSDGVKGWVNQAVLAPRRTGIVIGGERDLRASAAETAVPVARLKAGVIVRLRGCDANSEWCRVSIGDYRGYLRRAVLWGLLPGEVVQ